MSFSIARLLMLALFTALFASRAAAQEDLSVEALKKLFEHQREVFSEAQSNGLGATRGLKLITVDDVTAEATTTPTAEEATTVTAEEATTVANEGTTTVATESRTQTDSTTTNTTTAETSPSTDDTVVTTAAVSDPNKPLVFGQLDPELQVNLRIKFGFDSAALSAEETPKLAKMCTVLKESDLNLIRIVGHTDTSGSDAYNERLSILRAKEVARHLIENCGIDPKRLETVGLGERFPFNAADPKAEENRRVEFQALS
ncbi:OmpA family protein [Sulfitobacter sp. G21635-S1]|uniref:OmpA family protein n=1 Tax=Sulfitobacter sp. G21635-S1 TaxID=3014043 RepID=UPI0022AED966|nr:OmpA family protein [Sulfitobacter sp. G21635-S1]